MKTTEMEMAEKGEFLREYGQKYFVVAVEALEIGRVKWSMVRIGSNGKDEVNFYLPAEDMFMLCQELKRGVAQKKIANDPSSYPSAYKYVTGEKGSIHLNIGASKKNGNVSNGVASIQMQDASNNYIMAVSIGALEKMAEKYLLDIGYTPATPGSYCAKITKAFEDGRMKRVGAFKKVKEELVEETPTEPVEDTNTEPKETSKTNPKPVEDTKSDESEATKEYTVKVQGSKTVSKGYYVFRGTMNDESIRLLIKGDDTKNLPWYKEFEKKAGTADGTEITVTGERRKDCILVNAN